MALSPTDAERRDVQDPARDRAAARRDDDGDARDVAGKRRDEASDERDAAGNRRDSNGEQRDDAAAVRDDLAERADGRNDSQDPVERARAATARLEAASDREASKRDRNAGASDRSQAGQDRATPLADREPGAEERNRAGRDRHTSLTDRDLSADERRSAALDPLTGAYTRGAGLIELEREMARARRTGEPLTLAFVDIDHLKSVNDSRGHSAGDRLIMRVAERLQLLHRQYDLTIRYGGDEFLCVFQGVDMAGAQTRLEAINTSLAASADGASVSVGLTQMWHGDSIDHLVERADKAMYEDRRLRLGPEE